MAFINPIELLLPETLSDQTEKIIAAYNPNQNKADSVQIQRISKVHYASRIGLDKLFSSSKPARKKVDDEMDVDDDDDEEEEEDDDFIRNAKQVYFQ